MASDFRPAISIKEAIDHVDNQDYLLPAIQRKFVWSAQQIEALFDSLMRGYPINSFMFWRITDSDIKKNYKFYKFLDSYREFFKVDNPSFDAIGFRDFDAVIDGQQRLTSLYIGLKGTYAYKLPRKWWKDDEENLPTRRLYLNLTSTGNEEDNLSLLYDFKFLTDSECKTMHNNTHDFWFCVRDILDITDINKLFNYAKKHELKENENAVLSLLFQRIHVDKRINYYEEEKQNIDSVLDIFIRTNSGGSPLSFSNLLMSITTANWVTEDGSDARASLSKLVKDVFDIGNPSFVISEDFILKTCLVLHSDNIRFNVKNFNKETVDLISRNWDRIRKCIINVFKLLENWGFNDQSVRAKYAVIPLVYYVYWKNIEDGILKKTDHISVKDAMRKWLCMALLKGAFGGQPDNMLTKLRKVINDNMEKENYPLHEIVEAFRGQDRNFTIDDDFIEGLLKTQKDSNICYPILALIYSHMSFENDKYHKDHLHPANAFSKKNLIAKFGSEEKIPQVYNNPEYWNGIVNLQLLNSGLNESKNDMPLEEWLSENNINKETQLIPQGVSYKFEDFQKFYETRKKILVECLKTKTTLEEIEKL